jgi:PTS system nitrogen regulatory IIA component
MVGRIARNGLIENQEDVLKAIIEREKKMSTGMNNGVAIPHGKTDSVKQLVTAVALKKAGIDFDATDGKPSTIFIMTISPLSRSGPHIQFLAEVSKILRDARCRQRLLNAKTVEEVKQVFSQRWEK